MLSGDNTSDRIIHINNSKTEVFKDEYAYLEDSSSKMFKKHLKYENHLFQTMIDELDSEIETWEDDYKKMSSYAYPISIHYAQNSRKWIVGKNEYTLHFQTSLHNVSFSVWITLKTKGIHKLVWNKSNLKAFCEDNEGLEGLDGEGLGGEGLFGYIEDSTSGAEHNQLIVCSLSESKTKELYKIKEVGDTFAISNKYIYYLKNNDSDLKFDDCICISKFDNKFIKKIYSEKDDKYQLLIVKPNNQSDIFLQRTNWLYQDVGIINDSNPSNERLTKLEEKLMALKVHYFLCISYIC